MNKKTPAHPEKKKSQSPKVSREKNIFSPSSAFQFLLNQAPLALLSTLILCSGYLLFEENSPEKNLGLSHSLYFIF
jgi:hypothetical protein